ncbi:MAG: ABC transporter permease [Gemmatimonadetes bacterium]|nr:ABC transporter permease [Gemmatimonadota bacterium]
MTGYVIRRLLQIVPVLIGITLVAFLVFYFTPGDPVALMLGEIGTPEVEAQLRVSLGLDQPAYLQYLRFLGGLVQGDLGTSYLSRLPVTTTLWPALWATFQLTTSALLVAILIGVPVGVLAAVKRARFLDYFSMSFAVAGVSAPVFWTGMLFIYLFSLKLRWFPAGGSESVSSIVLPMFTLGIFCAGFLARMTRSCMLEVLGQDYIRTARAKGLSETIVLAKHAFRNAAIPIVTVVGLQFGSLMGGSILTETVFAWPGIGRVVIQAIFQRDAPTVQGGIVIIGTMFSLINLAVDLLYAKLDPSIRYS